jgi:hypothetical protein
MDWAVLLLNLVHVVLWLAVILGGFLSPRLAHANLLGSVPLIYLLHLLPFHVLVRAKVRRIAAATPERPAPPALPDSPCAGLLEAQVQQQVRTLVPPGTNDARVVEIARTYLAEERRLGLPSLLRRINGCVFRDAFQKPFSAQGLLILAAVANYATLALLWRR